MVSHYSVGGGVSSLHWPVTDYVGLVCRQCQTKQDLMELVNTVMRLRYIWPNQTLPMYWAEIFSKY